MWRLGFAVISFSMSIKDFIPILRWLPRYKRGDLRFDLLAGLTVGVMAVPQVMAYAQLAGLPPVYGLYASITPLIVYALLGTSPQLSVGPTAVVSLLVLTGIGSINGVEVGSELFITLAIATAFLSGVVQLLLGAFRLGFLVSFLSRPVISGFTSAAAVLIFLSQMKYLLGIEAARSSGAWDMVKALLPKITETNLPTLVLGLLSLFILILFKRWAPRWPGALFVMIVATGAVYFFKLTDYGIAVVGDIPRGLPSFVWPFSEEVNIAAIIPASLTIGLISFIESLAIAKKIEGRRGTYRINPDQELNALGFSKIIGAFFQAFPTTGSFSRSAMNDYSDARSGLASLVGALLVTLVLLYLTPIMFFLPQAVLAAVIIMAVYGLIEWQEALHLWRLDRRDWMGLFATFILTLFMGVQAGVLTGVTLSLALMVYHNSKPHLAVLGRLPNTNIFRNISRFRTAQEEDDILIVRFDAQLYFGNAEYFRESIEKIILERSHRPKLLILDASSIHDMDSTGIYEFKRLLKELDKHHIQFYISGVIGPVRDALSRNNLTQRIGPRCQFLTIASAVDNYHSDPKQDMWSSHAIQSND